MKRKHIITISGKPGSGKSSTADKVAELLGYTKHSSGDLVRRILADTKMTLEEYNQQAQSDARLDEKVDGQLRALRDKKDIVVDSRLGFYWIPESFKVYLDLDIELATVRIYKDAVNNKLRSNVGANDTSLSSVSQKVQQRMRSEQSRFRSLYSVDPFDTSRFDFVIDTSRQNPHSVAVAIFDAYRKWINSEHWQPQRNEVPLGYSFKNQY